MAEPKGFSERLAELRERIRTGAETADDRRALAALSESMPKMAAAVAAIEKRGEFLGVNVDRIASAGRAPVRLGIPSAELLDLTPAELLDIAENELGFEAAMGAAWERGRQQAAGVSGDVVRQRMAELGWSAARLAEKAGCGERTVRRYLAGGGKLRAKTKQEVATALGLEVGDLR